MNRLAHWMMRLYPARWRKRYGDELDALLTETGADTRIVANLGAGAIRMQFSTWSFTKLAVVLGAAGMCLGVLSSFLIKPVYTSQATLQIDPAVEQQLEPLVLSRESLSVIINDPRALLYTHELGLKPLEEVIDTMRRDITIARTPRTDDFTISFRYRDPEITQRAANSLAQAFIFPPLNAAGPSHTNYVEVIDNASLPIRVVPRIDIILPWLCAGLVAAGLVSRRRARRKSILTWKFGLALAASMLVTLIAGSSFAFLATHQPGGSRLPGVRFRSTALIRLNGAAEQNRSLLRDTAKPNQHLTISQSASDPHYFAIAYESRDRFEAQKSARMFINRLDEATLFGRMPLDASLTLPVQIQPAMLRLPAQPQAAINPHHAIAALKGGLAGLLLAALIVMIRNRWKPEPDFPLNPVNE